MNASERRGCVIGGIALLLVVLFCGVIPYIWAANGGLIRVLDPAPEATPQVAEQPAAPAVGVEDPIEAVSQLHETTSDADLSVTDEQVTAEEGAVVEPVTEQERGALAQDPNQELSAEDAPRRWPVGGDAFALALDVMLVDPENPGEVYFSRNLCDHSHPLCKDTGISLSLFGEANLRDLIEEADLPSGREYSILMRTRTTSNTENTAWTILWYMACDGDVKAFWPHALQLEFVAGPEGGVCDLYFVRDMWLHDPLGETVLNLNEVYNTSLSKNGSTQLGLFFGGSSSVVSLMDVNGQPVSTVGVSLRDETRFDSDLQVVTRTQSHLPFQDSTVHHYRMEILPYGAPWLNVGEIVLEPYGEGEATFRQFENIPNAPLPVFTAGSE